MKKPLNGFILEITFKDKYELERIQRAMHDEMIVEWAKEIGFIAGNTENGIVFGGTTLPCYKISSDGKLTIILNGNEWDTMSDDFYQVALRPFKD